MNPTSQPPAQPWYREPWPWLLMAGPFIVLIGCFITIYLAFTRFAHEPIQDPSAVRRGLLIEQVQAEPAGRPADGRASGGRRP
ncbi:nitrogen fixation protein FixH [Achromobacter sp. Marseille-Q4962]|jgi:hypothetical protein|uniref:nitrogen fixation protein FixH n=1 Tax=Achromobacter sp. Marseille-Q4962 TaxID=2942202 RepID=UPI0020731D81|nr:nitrogen fixation protein FixH [Achromobacter sp. Marseille-Q4962]